MDNSKPKAAYGINLLTLTCNLPVSENEFDRIYLKHGVSRILPVDGGKYIQVKKGERFKIENLTLNFNVMPENDTIDIELWYKKNMFKDVLAGRFFLMLFNLSETGISATQLIRSSSQEQSHYLLHWELQTNVSKEEEIKDKESFKLGE